MKRVERSQVVVPFRLTFKQYGLGLIAAAFAFLIYANSIGHGYVLDDYSAITINKFVQEGFAGIPKLMSVDFWHFSNMQLGYYRPLSLITFAMEYQFFGAAPGVSHLINVLFYALAIYLVFILLCRIFRDYNILLPLVITLLFAAHPIHTEVIDNIKGRDELLSFLNTMAMLWFAVRYVDDKKWISLLLSLLLFYFALLSKESALTGIVLLPLVIYYTQKRPLSETVLKTLPYLAVVFIFFIQKRWALGSVAAIIPNDLINYPYHAEAVKFSSVFMLFLFSIRMLFFPYPLRYDYSYNQLPAVGWESGWAWLGLLVFIGMLVVAGLQVKKRSWYGLALGVFYIGMIPLVGFILLRGGIFAERNLFTPALGFCIGIALLFGKIAKADFTSNSRIKTSILFLVSTMIIVFLYSMATIQRNRMWNDSFTLFENDLKTGKNSAQNQLHFGSDLVVMAVNEKEVKKKDSMINVGMGSMRQALRIHPTFGDALFRYGYAYEVKITYQREMKYVDSAIWYFNKAIEFAPGFSDAYRHLGIIYEWIQRYDVASYYYNKAFEINPTSWEAKQKADELRATKGLDVKVNPLMKP